MFSTAEDRHYNFCLDNQRVYLHYVCPYYQWKDFMTIEALDILEMAMARSIENIAKSTETNRQRLWDLLPKGVGEYGLIDYVGISNVPFGPQALIKLGYRNLSHKSPCLLSEYLSDTDGVIPTDHDMNTHGMYFTHPSKLNRPIFYEDYHNHDFCRLWYKMDTLMSLDD